MNLKPLELTFWGVRGSIPTPFPENLGFGGNTACIAIRFGDQPLLIFDGGSGIRSLGNTLMGSLKTQEIDFHLFLTHFHWDHIQGIPFFSPMYHPNSRTTIYSGEEPERLHHILARQMEPPYYPVPMPSTEPNVAYRRIESEGKHVGDVFVRPFPLHHPNGAFGYRIESPGACVVYASDHEHGNAETDSHLRQWAEGADLLIYDAQYTPDEYESHRGWGHSTWRKGVELAREAKVGQLVLFHHDPLRSDHQLAAIVRQAQAEFEHTMAATEGWSARFGAKL
jgi:phosphoribosyl 1,2-cyclic phosphodiesterase